MRPRQFPQRIGILLVPGSDYNQLRLFLHQLIHDMGDKIQTFGFYQAGDHGQHRDIPVYGQPQFPLHRFFCQRLFHEHVRSIKMNRNVRIRLRIVFLFIHPVQDASDLSGAQRHIILQPFPKIRIGDLFRVGRAYGGNIIRIAHPGLHKIHVAGIFDISVMQQAQGHSQHVFHNIPAKHALIFQVMDRINIFQPLIERVLHKIFFQIGAQQPRVPVIAVDHVRTESDIRQHSQHRFGKKAKPLRIILVSVQLIPHKIIFVVDEIYRDPVLHQFLYTHILIAPRKVNRAGIHRFHPVFVIPADAPVIGDHQRRFDTQGLQRFGQRPHYISQPAGLNKRSSLRCYK